MTVDDRIYSCDDHLDLWVLPRDLWEDRLPKHLRERGPRVVQQEAGVVPAVLDKIQTAIAESEKSHAAELRFAVEAAFDLSDLLRGLTPRQRAHHSQH